MAYRKCKIYFDGSHHIAIPPQPRKPRPKKGAKVKKEVPELEELDAEEEDCPFDNPVQLSLFDDNDDKRQSKETAPLLTEEMLPKVLRQIPHLPAKRYSSGCIKNICINQEGKERAQSSRECCLIARITRTRNSLWN